MRVGAKMKYRLKCVLVTKNNGLSSLMRFVLRGVKVIDLDRGKAYLIHCVERGKTVSGNDVCRCKLDLERKKKNRSVGFHGKIKIRVGKRNLRTGCPILTNTCQKTVPKSPVV